jgi:serine/threonine protein phosphatase PrpC
LVSQFALHEVQRRLEHHETFISNITKAFIDTFVQVNADLATEPYIEPLYAGTTACVGLLRQSQLICANVGDSRAVCARRYESNDSNTVGDTASTNSNVGGNDPGSQDRVVDPQFQAIPLTQDQNPDWEPEMTRIEQMGGFVSPPPEPGLSARVWLDPDWTQIGLAMARSLGDYAVKKIGVIAEPIVTIHNIQPEDEFVIFATDGVWEFISSQEAVDLVGGHLAHHNDATKACQALMELAAERWHEEEGDYRDDITALVVRLPLLWESTTTTTATAT